MYYHRITNPKIYLVKSMIDNAASITNDDKFLIDELKDVNLYLFEYNKSNNIRLIYLKEIDPNDKRKDEHWEIILKKKNNQLEITKKLNTDIKIPFDSKELFRENNSPKHLPIYERVCPNFTFGHYDESELLSMTNVPNIKYLLSYRNVDNIDYYNLVKYVFNQYNSGEISIKNLDTGDIQYANYQLYDKKDHEKAKKFKELVEELFYGPYIFCSKHTPLSLEECFSDHTRCYIVYKNEMYYSVVYRSFVDNMLPPEYYNVITATYSKSFDLIWNSLTNDTKCEILRANFESAVIQKN